MKMEYIARIQGEIAGHVVQVDGVVRAKLPIAQMPPDDLQRLHLVLKYIIIIS